MKLEIENEALSVAVSAIAKCADTADAQSPHKMFWMSISKDGKTDFVARDSMGYYARVTPVNKAIIIDKGQDRVDVCLPFNEFKELVSQCSTEILQMEVLDEEVVIRFKGQKGKYKLRRGLVNLPEEPKLGDKYVDLDADEFCNMLACTFISAFNDNSHHFSSIRIIINSDGVIAYSTDAERASKYAIEEKGLSGEEHLILIPRIAVERLKNMTFGAGVRFYIDEDTIGLTSGNNFIFYGPQGKSDNDFPKIIQDCFDFGIQASLYIDKAQLKTKLGLASIIGKDKNVKIALDGKSISLDTKDITGETSDEISGTLDPDITNEQPAPVNVSIKNLKDAINNIEDDEVRLQWRNPPKFISARGYTSFLAIQEGAWIYLLMPAPNDSDKSDDDNEE